MPTYKFPGVYIEEQPANGPIAGVGTSTAAFLGPTVTGVGLVNRPVKVTNWTQFKTLFGEYQSTPRLYLPHAVRGFFDNGGTVAYIVRVGTGAAASIELDDSSGTSGSKSLRIEAKIEGTVGNSMTVAVIPAHIVSGAKVANPAHVAIQAAKTGAKSILLQNPGDEKQFQPGDTITLEGTTEQALISQVRTGELVLSETLAADHANTEFVRIADLAVGQNRFRIDKVAGIERGSVLHLEEADTKGDYVVDAVEGNFVVLADPGLVATYPLGVGKDVAVTTNEFTLEIKKSGGTETLSSLSMDNRHSRYFGAVVNSNLVNVLLPSTPSIQRPPKNMPKTVGATNLSGGNDDDPGGLGVNQYTAALAALERVDDVNMVCLPDAWNNVDIQSTSRNHCDKMKDRFAILDAQRTTAAVGTELDKVKGQRKVLVSAAGFAAFYYPWIWISDPASRSGNDRILVPPSGHMAGVYARSDSTRGVHKAPANEFIAGALDLEFILNDDDQGELNVLGIDVLRVFPGQARPVVWGARTTAPPEQTVFQYVNVRRLFLFVEKSIQQGIRWAVFEPNDQSLWKKLERTIAEFLTRVWRSGALFGKTAAEAFYVRIDEELNPPGVRALGQVIIEIGIAPVRPAEFVIVRIAAWDGGGKVSEG